MPVDKRLLEILCCPVSKTPVVPASKNQLAALNAAIAKGGALNVAGGTLEAPVGEALITTDGKVLYRVEDGIPVMLPEEGIGTTQFHDFPR
jgi:uncharacterized protein YbaR (Trm112 family)